MKVELNITHETFKDDNGIVKPYVAFKFELDGETFAVSVRDKDKKLLNYLLKQRGFYDEKTDTDIIC